jgi:selenocysteine lyase/cysteine desulfurase
MNPAEVRALFPACRRYAYLNAAASSPLATPVANAAIAHLRDTEENGDLAFLTWLAFKEEVRSKLSAFLGAHPDEVGFLPSTSVGFHVIAHVLKQQGVTEVLTLEQEFPSTTLPLLHQGLVLNVVKPRADGSYALADIEAALGKRTGAVAVSAVQYRTGFRLDLAALGQLCKRRGIIFAVNAAQAAGQMPIDVHALGIDLLAATSHKWMMGGYGVGFLVAQRKWHTPGWLPFVGWLSTSPEQRWLPFPSTRIEPTPTGFLAEGAAFRNHASALEAGGGSYSTLYAFNAALEILVRVGMQQVLEHNLALQAQLRGQLRKRGFSPNTPDAPEHGSGICVVGVEGDVNQAVAALLKEGVVCTARGGGLRLSTHIFNDPSDIERAMAAFDAVRLQPA